jgi:hypothetical protein
MLIYIREEERQEMLKPLTIQDVPTHLKTRFEHEQTLLHNLDMLKKKKRSHDYVYIVSDEILKGW